MDNSIKHANHIRFWTRDPLVCSIIENVADGVIGIDTNGYIELFNLAAEKLFGYSAGEVIGHNIKILMPIEVSEHHDEYLAQYSKTKERHIISNGREVEGRRKDGTIFPMYLSVGEVKAYDFHGFIGITHDLSKQRLAAQQVTKAGKFLQAIIDSMSSILVGIDSQGLITHWNQSATKDRGVEASRAIGKPFVEMFPLCGITTQELVRVIQESSPLKRERLPINIRGETRYIDLVIFPLMHDFSGAVARLDDVTERVRMEEVMVQTEKMLSVGGLAAGIAHEINNPLGIISGACQNLRRRISETLDDNKVEADRLGLNLERMQEYFKLRKIFQFLEDIQEATARAGSIVSDILVYSRRSVSSFIPIKMKELIDAALRFAKHDFDLKKSYDFQRIEIRREGDEDAIVHCDKVAIEQVLLNLLRNAAQAMGSCSPPVVTPEIVIKVVNEGAWVRLEVSDNGPGMSEEISRRAFEPFFTTKPVGVGTGLGLSVTYFIITQQHHGVIQLGTAPGQGAHFVIRLPRDGVSYVADDFSCR